MEDQSNIRYGVLDTSCNSIYSVFDTLELAKRQMEIQAVEEYTERVESLEDLVRDHEKTMMLRTQHTKKKQCKQAKKPAKKPIKKGKPKKDEEESDEESESESEVSEQSSEPDYTYPTEDIEAELKATKEELADRYQMLLNARNCYRLVELRILQQSVNYC
jgi:Mg-chelatase subunit ChlI